MENAETIQTPPLEKLAGKAQPERLDLSRLSPPEDLEKLKLEEMTIDGICGVY